MAKLNQKFRDKYINPYPSKFISFLQRSININNPTIDNKCIYYLMNKNDIFVVSIVFLIPLANNDSLSISLLIITISEFLLFNINVFLFFSYSPIYCLIFSYNLARPIRPSMLSLYFSYGISPSFY